MEKTETERENRERERAEKEIIQGDTHRGTETEGERARKR